MTTRPIGFSTGALALGDFRKALGLLRKTDCRAVELSALRDHELGPLMKALPQLNLDQFEYVSVHVPSKCKTLTEVEVAKALRPCIGLGFPIVIHPDVIQDYDCWKRFGPLLCIENMDLRKTTGQTAELLAPFFVAFPEARFCLDLAHAQQVDPTMKVAEQLLEQFVDRLEQIHISRVDADGKHMTLADAVVDDFKELAFKIKKTVPIIIESAIMPAQIKLEIAATQLALPVQQ